MILRKFTFIAVLFFLYSINAYAQGYILPNEQLIFSFQTINHKQVVLAKDTADNYIVYRYGTKDNVEMEFPEKTKTSFNKFKYSFYLRGGGARNEGMDLDYFYFYNNNYQYIIYQTYHAVGEKSAIGIKVTDTLTNKSVDIKGIYKTHKGTLVDFRDNKLVEIGDELFE